MNNSKTTGCASSHEFTNHRRCYNITKKYEANKLSSESSSLNLKPSSSSSLSVSYNRSHIRKLF